MQANLQPAFHLAVRNARRAANLRQGELAAKVGCTQSALSMFESGKAGVVARETVAKIAEALGLELPADIGGGVISAAAPALSLAPAIERVVFCPNFQCLSNIPYTIGGQMLFMPLRSAGCGHRCALCGEIMEVACPACGAPVAKAGGCCGECGEPLVKWPDGFAPDPVAWAAAQRAAIAELRAFASGN